MRDSDVQINMKLEAPLVFSNEFLFTRHFRIQCDTKAAKGESCSFIPCRMVYLRHFETLEFVQRMTSKVNTRCFRQGLFSNKTMHCC